MRCMEKHSDAFNITELFYSSAGKHPSKTALHYRDHAITFSALEQQVTDYAQYLLSKGISKGDRVMVFLPMSIDLYRTVLAIFSIGATAVFLDEWVSKSRMEACCRVAPCKALIGRFKVRLLSLLSSELRKIPIMLSAKYVQPEKKYAVPLTTADDTALITFTTGSTGIPKAAKRTHGFLRAQFDVLLQKIQTHDHEIDMPVLPIVLLMNFGTGTTSVIADFNARKPDTLQPENILKQLKKYQVTRIIASPFFIKQIAKHLISTKAKTPNLTRIITGGAPVFMAEATIYCEAFPDATIEIVYGSTESEPISSISAFQLIKENNKNSLRGLPVGRVDKNTSVKIIPVTDASLHLHADEELSELQSPPYVIGEIIVSGKHVLREYINNEEALKRNKIFIQGTCWHRTGDSGFMDDEGNLYLTGRCNSLIHIKEQLLAPFVYENYFLSINGVETGTIMLKEGRFYAIIEANSFADKELITQEIHKHPIPPEQILFMNKIPRDPRHNSKIDYAKLFKLCLVK